MKEVRSAQNGMVTVELRDNDGILIVRRYGLGNEGLGLVNKISRRAVVFGSGDENEKEEFVKKVKAAGCKYTDINGNTL